MSKFTDDTVLDAALNEVKNNVTEIYLCTSLPTTRAEAIAAAVASKTGLTTGDFTGPVDGDASGRKLTSNAHNGITASASGAAINVALCTGAVLKHATDNTSQEVTSGNPVNIGAFDIEFADVTQ